MQESDVITLDTAEMRLSRMRRSVLTTARLLRDEARPGSFRTKWAMLTLTYADAAGWDPRHVSGLVKCIREYLRRKGYPLRYVWVAELQKRGAVHYHLLLELPLGITLPKPDKRGWWRHGSTRIEWARHVLGYLAKYASKGLGDDRFPRGCRISGCGGLSADCRRQKRWWLCPKDVREHLGPNADPFRAPGGGWLCRVSGEWRPPEWGLVSISGTVLRLVRLADVLQFRQVPH